MADIFPAAKQRLALLELAKALGCRDNALRRDKCGDWRMAGADIFTPSPRASRS